jgi:hypothetical protein
VIVIAVLITSCVLLSCIAVQREGINEKITACKKGDSSLEEMPSVHCQQVNEWRNEFPEIQSHLDRIVAKDRRLNMAEFEAFSSWVTQQHLQAIEQVKSDHS